MAVLEHEIEDIKKELIRCSEINDRHFSVIDNQLVANHDVHIRNEEMLKNILVQTTKTNGRVTVLEDVSKKLETANALMHQMISMQHNQYEKFVDQQEILNGNGETKYVALSRYGLVEKVVYTGVGIILTAFVTAGAYAVFAYYKLHI